MPHVNPNSYNISALSRPHVPQKGATTYRSSSSIFGSHGQQGHWHSEVTRKDGNGNVTQTSMYGPDGRVATTNHEYDEDGKKTKMVTRNADGSLKGSFEYDTNGKLVNGFYNVYGNVKPESEH